MTTPILIVGAGPTGLVLALRLRRHGTPFRIVDAHDGPGEASRALVVHARTLEFYRQLGLADRVVAAGARVNTMHMREKGKEVGTFSLQDMGEGLSPYPFALGLPQDEHERLLVDTLAQEGVMVEWGTRLDHLHQDADGVDAALSRNGQQEHARFDWVAGCDGAHSQVRASVGAAMEGGTYDRLYYVADVTLFAPAASGFTVALDKGEIALMLPARRGKSQRLIGYVPPDQEGSPEFRGRPRGRRAPAGHTGGRRPLVLHLPGPPPGCVPLPGWTVLPAGRRRASAQPGGRPGHEHRHRRRGEPELEAGRRGCRPGRRRLCWAPMRPNGSPSPASWSRRPIASSR